MAGEKLKKYLSFIYQDEHYFRNTIYVLLCIPDGCVEIYNEIFRIRRADGSIEEKTVLAAGCLRQLLIERFNFSETFIDSFDLNSEKIKPTLRIMLNKLWLQSKNSPAMGQMIFNQMNQPNPDALREACFDNPTVAELTRK